MTDFTYYVRSDSPDDLGNGTEDRIDGPNRAFRTWMGAEAALQGDLVTPGDTVTILGRAGAYTRVVWDGWTTSSTNRIFVGAVAGHEHDGVIGGGIVFENDADFFTTFYSLEYLSARDIEIRNPRAGGGGCVFLQTGSGTHERLILGPSAAYGADFNSSPNNLDASVIYDCTTWGIRYQSFRFGTVRNSGIFKSGGNGVELQGGAGNCTFYNSVSHGNTGSDFTGDSFLGSHNASGDGTQPGASGVPAVVDGDFTDFTNNDYTLAGTGSQLYDAGNVAELPSVDITNTPYTTSDIGAYGLQGAPPGLEGDVTDSIVISDTVSAVGRYSRSVTDAMTHSDGQAGIGRYVRDTADNVELSDLVDALQELLGSIADEAQYTDAIVALATLTAAIQDGMTLQDTISAVTEAIATLQDQQQYTDTLDAIRARLATLSDEQAFSDMVSGEIIGSAFRSLSDSQALSDAVTAVATYLGASTDTVTLSDVLIGVVSASRSLADAFTFGDSISATTETTGFVLELYELSDSATYLTRLVGRLADAYVWSDSLSVQAFKRADTADSVLWSDSISYPALGGYLRAVVTLKRAMTAHVTIRG